jgi:hypothetical protein
MPKRLLTAVLALAVFAFAKEFAPPPAQPAASYPLHETHANEHLTIAVDPYDTPEKLAGAKVHYAGHDLLPLRFILTNDGDQPILLRDINIELITGARDKISPASLDDLLRRLAHPDKNPDRSTRVTQWPVPKFGKPQRVKADQQDEISNLFFRVKAVDPHATQSGFLFFDVQGLTDPLSRSRLYITGIGDSAGNELLYFEIPLDKSAAPQ